ncbi:MAG: Ig-like domain-containing protein [Prevotella sp.]|nr:Ig-like domain-containing protein [Bacteroides sp.]MCM1437173.1 Ig-like domain-containing protein [Prevotella sp.]
MKRLLMAALAATSILGLSAKEWTVENWKADDPETSKILTEGLTDPEGIVQLKFEQGTGTQPPEMSAWSVKFYPGNYLSVKILKEGYSLRHIVAGTSFHKRYGGNICSVGVMDAMSFTGYAESLNPKVYWDRQGKEGVTELHITSAKFSETVTSDSFSGPFTVEFEKDSKASMPDGLYIPGEPSEVSNLPQTILYELHSSDPNAQIRYVVYPYEEGMTEPDVTESSNLYDPANSSILMDVDYETLNGRNLRVAVRGFVDGKEPSDIHRSRLFKPTISIKTADKINDAYDARQPRSVYTGNATVMAIIPGFDYNTSTKKYYPSKSEMMVFLRDESGTFHFEGYHSDISAQWDDIKVGDVVTYICGEIYRGGVKSNGEVWEPWFEGNKYSGAQPAPLHKVDGAEPIKMERVECTQKTFNNVPNYTPIVLKGEKINTTYSSGTYYTFGSYSSTNGVKGYWAGESKSGITKCEEMTIPKNQAVDVYGYKTEKGTFYIERWEITKAPAEKPYIFPDDSFFSPSMEVAANQKISFNLYSDLDAQIHYTLDGSDPTEQSPLFIHSFDLPEGESVTVKARAFGERFLPSEILTKTYIRNDKLAANFDFTQPELLNPVMEIPVDGGKNVLTDGITFTSKAGQGKVKMKLTAPDEKHPVRIDDFDGRKVLFLPVGTRIDIESTHDINAVQFQEIEGNSVSQWLEFADVNYRFNYNFDSNNAYVKKYTEDIYNVSLITKKNRDFNFMSIDVIFDPKIEFATPVEALDEVSVLEDSSLVQFSKDITVHHVHTGELYITDSKGNAVMAKAADTSAVKSGSTLASMRGRMLTDENGTRYFSLENEEPVFTEGTPVAPSETNASNLYNNLWKIVTLKEVILAGDNNDGYQLVDKNDNTANVDYHFGDILMPQNRWCDVTGIVRADNRGITFAPISFIKLHVAPEAVTLDKTEASIFKGESLQLSATITPDDADDKSITWSSSDETVASVSETGLVTALKAGQTTITATHAEGLSATCILTVNNILPASITIEAPEEEITEGDSMTLTAVVLPENAEDKSIIWKSSDEEIATIDQNGLLTTIKEGTVTITATSVSNEEVSSSVTIKVNHRIILPASITIEAPEEEITEGDSMTLTAVVLPENAEDKSIIWKSSDEEIATIDQNGLLTTIKEGTVTITATSVSNEEVSSSVTIKVNHRIILPASITIEAPEEEIFEGHSMILTAVVLPENAEDKSVVWASSDEDIATIDQSGLLTAVKEGTAVITATASANEEVSAVFTVTVKKDEGIETVSINETVRISGNELTVKGEVGVKYFVFDTAGRILQSIDGTGESIIVRLDAVTGVYHFVSSDGKISHKFYIR